MCGDGSAYASPTALAARDEAREEIKALGQVFLTRGVLERKLLPWLWRDLRPSIVDDPSQMDFLIELMTHLGLLTSLPGSDPPQWLLPPQEQPGRLAAEAARLAAEIDRYELAAELGSCYATYEALKREAGLLDMGDFGLQLLRLRQRLRRQLYRKPKLFMKLLFLKLLPRLQL